MINYYRYTLRTIASMMLFVIVTSCSIDDIEQGVPLPPGQYPLDLTVSVAGMKTRANGNDRWKNGDEISVRIGSDVEEGRYTLDNYGNIDVQNSAKILHWKTTAPATVKAWYPSTPQTNVSIADQSKLLDFSSIDYMAAVAENQNYKNTVGLTFKHSMAKVKCAIRSSDMIGVTVQDLMNATVTFSGYSIVSFQNGELSGSAFGDIAPITDRTNIVHECLLVPTDMTGKELFRISLNLGGYQKTFSYIPQGTDAKLQPGTTYFYTITLTRDKMVVDTFTASWDGDDEIISSTAIPLNLNPIKELPDDFWDNASMSDNVEWKEDEGCYKVQGNALTISMTVNRENLTKGFRVSEGVASINRVRVGNQHVFTIKMNTEFVTLEYAEYIQPGDFLYSNGRWRPDIVGLALGGDEPDSEGSSNNPNSGYYGYGYDDDDDEYDEDGNYIGKETWECIGVIFKVGPGQGDSVENYGGRLETIRGYAVALHDATAPPEIISWGPRTLVPEMGQYPRSSNLYDGYQNTQYVLSRTDLSSYPAFIKVNEYNDKVKMPEYFSTWYLPSIKQLEDLNELGIRRERILMAGGEDFILSETGILPDEDVDTFGAKYWSSTQHSDSLAWVFVFKSMKRYEISKDWTRYSRFYKSHVRTVMTF